LTLSLVRIFIRVLFDSALETVDGDRLSLSAISYMVTFLAMCYSRHSAAAPYTGMYGSSELSILISFNVPWCLKVLIVLRNTF
jgi:hypothetical protein